MDPGGVFNIGKRNCLALRKLLWKAGVMVSGEDLGGTVSRTVRLDVGRGEFWLRVPGALERRL
jgi:chemotaxis protein CheD